MTLTSAGDSHGRSKGKRVAIIQSCYIPWKGYFDLIGLADEFILYDDRQYTRRDWRNRNLIKTPQGPRWLTIPVQVKGRYSQRIDETLVADLDWGRRHWNAIEQNYAATSFFGEYQKLFEPLFANSLEERLSVINRIFIEAICGVLGIRTPISWSTDYEAEGSRSERLISLCRAAEASTYLSGPSAKSYLDEAAFAAAGIEVQFMDYDGYPVYAQRFPPFDHHVTVLDLIFNTGPEAPAYLKSLDRVSVR
jgi:hypothetical protein